MLYYLHLTHTLWEKQRNKNFFYFQQILTKEIAVFYLFFLGFCLSLPLFLSLLVSLVFSTHFLRIFEQKRTKKIEHPAVICRCRFTNFKGPIHLQICLGIGVYLLFRSHSYNIPPLCTYRHSLFACLAVPFGSVYRVYGCMRVNL